MAVRDIPVEAAGMVSWWVLGLGALLVVGGLSVQRPAVLAGDPLGHLLLLGTAAVLVLQRLRSGQPPRPAAAPWLAVTLALAAAAAAFASPLAGALRPVLLHGALALLALSLVAMLLGARAASRLAVPLLMLYLFVPVLPLFEAALSYPLRRLSALLAAVLLRLGPDEVHVAATELTWGSLRVSVTSACSGLTLLQNLLWVAWWTVLLRHRGLWRRLAHGLLAVPAVLMANTLRVVALALAAAWYGEDILTGTPHVIIGWVAVVLAVGLFLAMEQLFPATATAPQPPAD
ncbi:MAG: archaeosortase/exosortase family protein [Gammaproteobacteria bacterium]|jgi:exosortase|nr:archaeosortase/exosortase family protein [Gammaproteobacteria bacterium]